MSVFIRLRNALKVGWTMSQHKNKGWQVRERLAQLAAEYMAETGSQDFQLAKKKALHQFGGIESLNLPSNKEIQQALISYQHIFRFDSQPIQLKKLRQAALEAMHFLHRFKPRLVGNVLSGTADINSAIYIHLFAETSEEVAVFLMDNNIPYDEELKRFHMKGEEYEYFPAFAFLADETPVHLIVFSEQGLHHAPLSSVDGKPMQRADIKAVTKLIDS